MSAVFIRERKSNDLALFAKKIFTEQFETDVEIVSVDGTRHPCHKIFLTGNSPVFQAMLKGDSFKEGLTKTVELDMTEAGVVALLNFLYCRNSGDVEAEYNFDICRELLEASEKYSITNLQESLKSVFLQKHAQWFQVDGTLQLFCFLRNLEKESWKVLMRRCILALRSKHTEMTQSEVYKTQEALQRESSSCNGVVQPVVQVKC